MIYLACIVILVIVAIALSAVIWFSYQAGSCAEEDAHAEQDANGTAEQTHADDAT
jgi:uncharacterized protein YpmB